MSVFAAAIDALFADPNLGVDAVYRAGGADPAVPVRVILRRPDRVGEFGESRIVAETTVFDVRVADIAQPASPIYARGNNTHWVLNGWCEPWLLLASGLVSAAAG